VGVDIKKEEKYLRETGIHAFTSNSNASGDKDIYAAVGVDKYVRALSLMNMHRTKIDLKCMKIDEIEVYKQWPRIYLDGRNYSLKYGGDNNNILEFI